MVRLVIPYTLSAALLLLLLPIVLAHGDDEHGAAHDTGHAAIEADSHDGDPPMSYFAVGGHVGVIVAHVAIEVVAWMFILPIGVMLSISKSNFAIPTQFIFFGLNTLGLAVGVIYDASTPDLYVHNAHHKIGWVAFWIMAAQLLMSILLTFPNASSVGKGDVTEREAFLPISTEAIQNHDQNYPLRSMHEYRWSRDSGHGTEPASPFSEPGSPKMEPKDLDLPELGISPTTIEPKVHAAFRFTSWGLHRFLPKNTRQFMTGRVLSIIQILNEIILRTCLILGFIAAATGAVTYGGIMRGDAVLNGLAHFIKGGIFFWYGILTLSRWVGSFADLGWAWNVKPPPKARWKARVPSAELTESFVIFLYGCTNVFLEHLAAWGDRWTAQDLEHVSISIMFFGGGLCGMLVESRRVRTWLNAALISSAFTLSKQDAKHTNSFQEPSSHRFTGNPIPALIILLLGSMMSSHHQASALSTMVHKQWGTLLIGFSISRGITYILLYIKPPTSYLPSRPPSELLAAFCLMAGGLVFMASNKDIVGSMDYYGLNAMFVLTVVLGFTAFLMAWVIVVVAVKAWASRKNGVVVMRSFKEVA